jgi:glycosyltransferase involved in cell wall biosynthesis
MDAYRVSQELRKSFRSEVGAGDGEILLGVACAFRERKQLAHTIDAVERAEVPRVRLVLAGFPVADEPDYPEQILRYGRAKLGDRFQSIGPLTDLRPFCNGLDLYVNTSREETFGMSVLEAMACGCPIVGYDSKAVDEVVLPDGGEITTQDDVDTLALAIRRWCNRLDLGAGPRISARRQAERFDLKRLSAKTWEQYEAVLHLAAA